jgi:hypothetical protein
LAPFFVEFAMSEAHRPNPFGSAIPVPLIGRQPSVQQRQQIELMQAMGQLSLSMYVQLASRIIEGLDVYESLSPERVQRLQQLARETRTAAQAYFEGVGVITTKPPE